MLLTNTSHQHQQLLSQAEQTHPVVEPIARRTHQDRPIIRMRRRRRMRIASRGALILEKCLRRPLRCIVLCRSPARETAGDEKREECAREGEVHHCWSSVIPRGPRVRTREAGRRRSAQYHESSLLRLKLVVSFVCFLSGEATFGDKMATAVGPSWRLRLTPGPGRSGSSCNVGSSR